MEHRMSASRSQIVLLGTGTPNADPDRHGMSIAIVVDDVPYLFDLGPGVVRRAAAAHRNGIEALAVEKLNLAFLTHLHTDHTLGYPDLIFTPWVLGREEPLTVYGPAGTQHMTDHILAAYQADIDVRLNGLEPSNSIGYQVNVIEYGAGEIYQDDRLTVEAIPVIHGAWDAYAFKITTPDRVILFSGDTAPTETLRDHPCDVLIHEVYSVKGFASRPPEWKAYHSALHTSSHELADLANHLQPELVILVHHLFWGVTEDELVAEVNARYDGRVVCGRDLDVY
jgi:ribonuclease BN (tRNA processing enzyme)